MKETIKPDPEKGLMLRARKSGVPERLHFTDEGTPYHAYHAAQHVVRYACVRDLVANARVLDIACGEGYGAKLLTDWGAREVVGIDVSEEAIGIAQRLFSGEGRQFRVGNAEQVSQILEGAPPFDVIVSFETIEHLEHPDRFLEAIEHLKTDRTVVAISCPNENAVNGGRMQNGHHLRRYTFAEFKLQTENQLGPASTWLLGTSVTGEINVEANDNVWFIGRRDAHALLETRELSRSLVIPSTPNLAVTPETCSHYVGVWGRQVEANVVVVPQSITSFLEPWQAVGQIENERAALSHRIKCELEPETQSLRSNIAEYERKAECFEPQLESHTAEIKRLEAILCETTASMSVLADERALLLEDQQVMRRRSLTLAGQLSAALSRIAELKQIEAVLAESDRVRREYFEPRLQELELLKSSHGYRIIRLYVRLHNSPVLGWPVRLTKRFFRWIFRMS